MTAAQRPDGQPTPLDPAGELRGLAGDCVHCGFCLPACPTYQLWGEEMDSPRGRIHLITQILAGGGTAATVTHLDRCLGCMACVTACPSGVRYDRLLEAARGWVEQAPADAGSPGPGAAAPPLPGRSPRDRAVRAVIFGLFPYPRRLRAATFPLRVAQRTGLDTLIDRSGLAERLPVEIATALRLAPPPLARRIPPPQAGARSRRSPRGGLFRAGILPGRVPARGARRAVVGMLTGCVQQVFFPQANAATVNVLAAEGCDVIVPAGQGCCGALSLHGGRRAEAARFARRAIETFERAADLLAGDAGWSERAAALAGRVRDFSEFLAELGPVARRHPLDLTVAYHDACHLAHAQRIIAQPRQLLADIPRLRLAAIPDGGACCGSAGIYNLVQPDPARELGQRKAAAVAAAGADLLVSGNPGCAMQIASALAARRITMPMAHVAEVLDASIRGTGSRALLG